MTFLDTSVLVELVEVPGKSQHPDVIAQFQARAKAGEQFVIPITALIETGNHIAQASGYRRPAAERLMALVQLAIAGDAPFRLNQVSWDDRFLTELRSGNATGQTFVDLAGNGLMGTGDVAILVERDRFVATSAYAKSDVGIWTLENVLASYA